MKLHEDRNAFLALLNSVSSATGYRADILEKDYYITLFLKELSQRQDTIQAYFKGGTALYKALRSVRRFSEDIDLTVCIDNCSNSQAKKRLEVAANGYTSLPRTERKEMESNRKGSITSVYDYKSIVIANMSDSLQRFEHLKVEATSFTISEPVAPLTIAALIYDRANKEQQAVLRRQYDVTTFSINTILLERIFADKIFAAEFYYQRDNYFDVAKHVYDLAVMSELDSIRLLLTSRTELLKMLSYKRREEKMRIGSDLSDKKYTDFRVFGEMQNNKELFKHYNTMQEVYIFNDTDKKDYFDMCSALSSIYKVLCDIDYDDET